MPCVGGPSVPENYRDNSELESMLCSACRVLTRMNYDFDENPRLSEWWDAHKKSDQTREAMLNRQRLEREHAKEIAESKKLSELTKDEKALLKRYDFL